MAARIVAFVNANGAEFLIGAFLGLKEVGIYRVASRIAGAVAEVCYEPLRVMGWSAIASAAKQSSSRTRISETVEMLLSFAYFACLPIFVGLFFTSHELVNLVLARSDWLDAAPIISVLALAKLFGIVSLFSESSLSVLERGGLIPRMALLSMCLTTSLTALSGYLCPTSIAVAWAQLLTGVLMTLAHGAVLKHFLKWRLSVVGSEIRRPAFATALMALSLLALLTVLRQVNQGNGGWVLPAVVVSSAFIYLLTAGKGPWHQLNAILSVRKG